MTAEALAEIARAAAAPSGPGLAAEFAALVEETPRALHRDGGPRHLTASAIVVDAPGEHVALVWHRKGRFWVQPGGHLEAGETSFEAAARREVAEETGLEDLEVVGDGPAVLHRHGLDAAFGTCHEHWDVQYLLRTRRPAAAEPLRPSDESPEVVWVRWPLHDPEAAKTATLPEGTVPDLAPNLRELTRHLAARGA